MNKIFDTLISLSLISLKNKGLFSSHTINHKSLKILKDKEFILIDLKLLHHEYEKVLRKTNQTNPLISTVKVK